VATIRKRGENWHVQVRRKGAKTVTRSFSTKGAAATFARKIEHAMDVERNPDDVSTLSKITIVKAGAYTPKNLSRPRSGSARRI